MRVLSLFCVFALPFSHGHAHPHTRPSSKAQVTVTSSESRKENPKHKTSHKHIFQRIWKRAKAAIYDQKRARRHFTPATYKRLLAQAEKAPSLPALRKLVNSFLDTLQLSHTRLFTEDELTYHFLRSIFRPKEKEKWALWHIGVQLKRRGKVSVVRSVLEGYPAALAGLRRGDVLLEVDGKPYAEVGSWRGGKEARLRFSRGGKMMEVKLKPVYEALAYSFVEATKRSLRVYKWGKKRIGFVHLWTFNRTTLEVMQGLLRGPLRGVDGLILDLRDGFGGRWEGFRHLFFGSRKKYFKTVFFNRKGHKKRAWYWRRLRKMWRFCGHKQAPTPAQFYGAKRWQEQRRARRESKGAKKEARIARNIGRWLKSLYRRECFEAPYLGPMVVLINEGTRSAKEALAFQFKRARRALLVGTKTTGAFTAANIFFHDAKYTLLLGVSGILLDGQQLEGKGVAPDHTVSYPLDGKQSSDPQFTSAMRFLKMHLPGTRLWSIWKPLHKKATKSPTTRKSKTRGPTTRKSKARGPTTQKSKARGPTTQKSKAKRAPTTQKSKKARRPSGAPQQRDKG